MKDLFSAQSDAYKKYRPHYPLALYEYILSFVEHRETALDVATGNGQAAVALAAYFKQVIGIDSSAAQLAEAEQKENVTYKEAEAEQTFSKPHSFDLITVAQAYHWLQHAAFATEVRRIAKPGAVIAVWGYDRFQTGNADLNKLMDRFYFDIVGPYWDSARKDIDTHYAHLPFPFEPLPTRSFEIEAQWTKQHILGYLSSWSAVQNYMQVHHASPLLLIQDELDQIKITEHFPVRFPIFLRLGRV